MKYSVEYPKEYIRAYEDLDELMETVRRIDVQNTIENRAFSFDYIIEVGSLGYVLTITVTKVDGGDNKDFSRET